MYISFTKKKRIKQSSVQLDNGATGHWLGEETAKNVLIWFHGTNADIFVCGILD